MNKVNIENSVHNARPLFNTRWHDKDGRVTRKGFMDGCIERFSVVGNEEVDVTIVMVSDPTLPNAPLKLYYCVSLSDLGYPKDPAKFQNDNPCPGMYTTPSLKDARKACTYLRSGKLLVKGKFQ